MKGFIEVTSLRGNTRLIRTDLISMISKIVSFTEMEYTDLPELKDMESCVVISLQCSNSIYFIRDSYEIVIQKVQEAMQ